MALLRMSAKSVFDDHMAENELLITRSMTELPQMFVTQYKKNVIPLTPFKTGALRRSIVTQVMGNQANIAWRLPYAIDQDEGVDQKSGTVYHHWTTPGTGPHFKDKAFEATIKQVDPMFRELGLVK